MRRIKSHTMQKLEYIQKYISAYTVATKKLPFKYYIDAFAGSGLCILCDEKCKSRGKNKCSKCSRGKIVSGSAIIACNILNRFQRYIFIDLDKNCIKELKNAIKSFDEPLQNIIRIEQGDANVILKDFYKNASRFNGYLVLLDPEGPELKWKTIEALAKIPKIDLLILYPYDMAIVRLTKEYIELLDEFYGDKAWIDIYRDKNNCTAEKRKTALLNFYISNLNKLGLGQVVYKQIRKNIRDGHPLYHLILASRNSVAKNIMNDIFGKELDGQEKLKF